MRALAAVVAIAAALAIAPAADAKPKRHHSDRIIKTCPRQPVTAELVCFTR